MEKGADLWFTVKWLENLRLPDYIYLINFGLWVGKLFEFNFVVIVTFMIMHIIKQLLFLFQYNLLKTRQHFFLLRY